MPVGHSSRNSSVNDPRSSPWVVSGCSSTPAGSAWDTGAVTALTLRGAVAGTKEGLVDEAQRLALQLGVVLDGAVMAARDDDQLLRLGDRPAVEVDRML